MEIKKLAATTAMAGALGFAVFGVGSGIAQADPGPKWPHPPGNDDIWLPGDPPGHNPFGPPGQVKRDMFFNVPPGHWGDPAYVGLPVDWIPDEDLIPDGFEVFNPLPRLPLVFNPDAGTWGVWLDNGLARVFIPYPLPL